MNIWDEVLVMMKRLQWAGDGLTCPFCRGDGMDEKHDLDCELLALITKMESTPMVARPLGTGERVRAQETHVKAAR